jgi:hypothetical protein
LRCIHCFGKLASYSCFCKGFTNGSALIVVSYEGLWSRDIFYDLLSAGTTIRTLGGEKKILADFSILRKANELTDHCHQVKPVVKILSASFNLISLIITWSCHRCCL